MTLREALDLLELNERTLEQSMLESSLQNRLEHTELRHVLRVFEAYRKVNAFLNPSFNTQGDARLTIIDESLPGETLLQSARAASPATATAAAGINERDTFSDTMIETSSDWESLQQPKSTLALEPVRRRSEGVNLFAVLGLTAAAFGLGVLVLGPVLSPVLKPPVTSAVSPAPITAAPPVAPVTAVPPASAQVTPPVSQPTPPASVVSAPKAVAPIAPAAPVRSVTAKPATPPPVITKPPVAVAQVKPRVAVTQAPVVQPRVTQPRVSQARITPRRATAPRAAPPRAIPSRATTPTARRAAVAARISSRPVAPRAVSVSTPPRRAANQQQFSAWDNAGVVLRYRSWTLVPDAVRRLPASAFRAAVFVSRDPASLPDIQR